MRDLNDLWYFAVVVDHGGFSAAERATGISKASLSKAVSRLEDRLQVRLIERSTRRFRITELGEEVYRQCEAMIESVEAAEAIAARAVAEPYGSVRLTCQQGLLEGLVAILLPEFLRQFPKVRLQVKATNRPVDLIEEGIDLALGVREYMEVEGSLVARTLAPIHAILVASPSFLQQHPVSRLEDLEDLPTLSLQEDTASRVWQFFGPDGAAQTVVHQPRLGCGDVEVLREAATQGVGVALLPEHVCTRPIQAGELVHLLPPWSTPSGSVQAVFTSRKGLRPAVRALIDFLASEMPMILTRDTPRAHVG